MFCFIVSIIIWGNSLATPMTSTVLNGKRSDDTSLGALQVLINQHSQLLQQQSATIQSMEAQIKALQTSIAAVKTDLQTSVHTVKIEVDTLRDQFTAYKTHLKGQVKMSVTFCIVYSLLVLCDACQILYVSGTDKM